MSPQTGKRRPLTIPELLGHKSALYDARERLAQLAGDTTSDAVEQSIRSALDALSIAAGALERQIIETERVRQAAAAALDSRP